MKVIVNGTPHTINQSCTLEHLINSLQLKGKFAIEVNQTIIPRSDYLNTELCADDKVEIVQAIGGG